MYTTAGYSKDAYKAQVAANVAHKAAGEPHPKIWLPDSNNEDYYLIDMPGDDRYDSANSFGTGVCTDVHYDYMHTGCESQIGAQVTMGLTSCWPKAHPRGSVLCGVLVDIDEDYVHSVGIDIRSLIFPRVLVEEAQVNGITQQRDRVLPRARLHGQVRPLRAQGALGRAALAARVRAVQPAVPQQHRRDGAHRRAGARLRHHQRDPAGGALPQPGGVRVPGEPRSDSLCT